MNRTIPNGAAILLAFIRRTEVGRDDRASYDVIYANKQGKLAKPLTMKRKRSRRVRPSMSKRCTRKSAN